MSGYIQVPKDLTTVKSKLIFNLTKRQLICFGSAVAVGLPTYFLTKNVIGNSAAVLLMIGLMLPFFLLAMFERDGLPAEKILRNMLKVKLWRGKRPYKSQKSGNGITTTGKKQKNNTASHIKEVIFEKIFGRANPPESVQESIPYERIYKDGICRVNSRLYTKTVEFQDTNYQLAQNDDKAQIFGGYCTFLNYFDSSIHIQFTFINRRADFGEFAQSIAIPRKDDDFDDIRQEYDGILKNQLAKGNNGIVKTKYITFGVEADNLREAKSRLERIETDVIANFKALGVSSRSLNGYERLDVLRAQLHPLNSGKTGEKYDFDMSEISTKDYIAPSSFDFSDGKTFKIGNNICTANFLQITSPELTDRLLSDFLELNTNLTVTMHIQPVEQNIAIKAVKRKISDLDAMKITEQKKAVRAGYDTDVLPSDLVTFGKEAKNLLENLQSRNEKMFRVTFIVLNTARNQRKLGNDVFAAAGVAQKHNCALKRLDWQQEQGLVSSLPLGINQVEVQRGLTTSSTAIFVPFTTQELFQKGEALYYGVNALSNNIIMADRKRLRNPNALFLGTPGSGKSFAAKREIVNVFLTTEDDIIISDPESEYFPVVNKLGGQVIKLSPISTQYINPMDINLNYSDDEEPLRLKSDFVLSLCELVTGGKTGLEPDEKSIIDRCVGLIYKNYFADPKPENMPILQDLYNSLLAFGNPKAERIALALEIYVTGSLNVFNHRTNVDISNRIVCFDIKELGKSLKKIAMLVLQDAIWNRVTSNRAAKKSTWIYFDEFHLLLKDEQTAMYCVEIWKRFRKYGGLPTALTQNVKDLLASPEIQNIFENSDFIYMLSQAAGDRQILAKQLGISPHQLSYVTHSNAGEGLLVYNNIIIPFADKFNQNTLLYSLLTSKMSEAVT